MCATGQLRLALQPDAAVDGGQAERAGAGQVGQLLADLAGELAGGHEHERGSAGIGRLEALDESQPEGQGLTRAGGRLHEDVAPGQNVGNDRALDGEGCGYAALRECALYGIGHAEIGEGLLGHLCSLRAAAGCGCHTNWEIRLTQNAMLGDKNLAGGGAAHLVDVSRGFLVPRRLDA